MRIFRDVFFWGMKIVLSLGKLSLVFLKKIYEFKVKGIIIIIIILSKTKQYITCSTAMHVECIHALVMVSLSPQIACS